MTKETQKSVGFNLGDIVETPKHGEGVIIGFFKTFGKDGKEYRGATVQVKSGERHFALNELEK